LGKRGINTGAVQNPEIVSQRSIPKIFKDKKGGIRGRFGRWKRSDGCENKKKNDKGWGQNDETWTEGS